MAKEQLWNTLIKAIEHFKKTKNYFQVMQNIEKL